MKNLITITLLLIGLYAHSQVTTLPAGSKQHSSYRSPDGRLWIGVPGGFFPFYTSAKVDSIINSIPVKNLTAGDNIILNKTNPDNWIISSTGGGSGSSNWGDISGTLSDQTDLWSELSSRMLVGGNISLLNNNAGYIVSGTEPLQVRNNSDLDSRYLQSESDPTVPSHVKNIATGDISNWNSKISSVTGGVGITVDATDPYNLVVNSDGGSSITLTGDVTGTGEGTIVTSIGDNAVTTAKINNAAVTLPKLQNISRGRLLGLGGGGTNTWTNTGTPMPSGFSGAWSPTFAASDGVMVEYGNKLYQASGYPTVGVPPPDNPNWVEIRSNFYGEWMPTTQYSPGASVAASPPGFGWGIYVTNASTIGVSPGTTPNNTPGPAREIGIGSGLAITGSDASGWELVAGSASSIAGTIIGGSNVTISGSGSQSNPYIINSTGGGGGGGSTSVIGGTNITVTGTGAPATPYTISNTYSLPTGSASVKGGFRVGSGLSVSGDVLSATGTAASVFTRSVAGLVPAPGGSGATRYLREDGTWVAPSGGGSGGGGISALTGDVLASGSGSVPATIATGAVTNAKLANMSANTIKGRLASSGAPQDLTIQQLRQAISNTTSVSGTTLNIGASSKFYRNASSNINFTLSNFAQGLDAQVEVKNTSSGPIVVSFTGVSYPSDASQTLPAGKTGLYSLTNISGTPRLTFVIYD